MEKCQTNYNVLLFSNPGDKVLILVTSRGQICPIVFYFLETLSPLLKKSITLKCWFNIFPSTLIHMVMLENCLTTFKFMVVLQFRETFLVFTSFMCMFLSKTVSNKNISTLVTRAALNKCKKR